MMRSGFRPRKDGRVSPWSKEQGYDSWLMVVNESGQVIQITKLDKSANAVGTISIK
ncbi:hypothetical protein D3C72_2422540 [compost metagenome]